MIDANIIARSHFTRKADGEQALYQFCRQVGIDHTSIPFSFNGKNTREGRETTFVAESWGGYVNADMKWVIFVSWRNSKLKETKVIHWDWLEDEQRVGEPREWGFRS